MKVDDGHYKTQEPNARFMSQHHRGLDRTALVPLTAFLGTDSENDSEVYSYVISGSATDRSHAESSGEFCAAQGFDRLWSRRKPTTVEHR